jgi:hypothetical protein
MSRCVCCRKTVCRTIYCYTDILLAKKFNEWPMLLEKKFLAPSMKREYFNFEDRGTMAGVTMCADCHIIINRDRISAMELLSRKLMTKAARRAFS